MCVLSYVLAMTTLDSATRPSALVTTPWQLTFALAVALAVAGVIHCLLTPEHMEISLVFGAGFLAAGVAQLGLAAMAVLRPSRLVYVAIIASTLGLAGMYAYNVVVGLPFHQPDPVAIATHEHASDVTHEESEHAPAHSDAQFGSADHHEGGVVLGAGEPIDPYGAITQLAQLSAAALAFSLLARTTPSGRTGSASAPLRSDGSSD